MGEFEAAFAERAARVSVRSADESLGTMKVLLFHDGLNLGAARGVGRRWRVGLGTLLGTTGLNLFGTNGPVPRRRWEYRPGDNRLNSPGLSCWTTARDLADKVKKLTLALPYGLSSRHLRSVVGSIT